MYLSLAIFLYIFKTKDLYVKVIFESYVSCKIILKIFYVFLVKSNFYIGQ